MGRMELSLGTLPEFDFGKASVAFQQALKRIVLDCTDRPGDKRARTIVLTTTIVPVVQQDGDVVDVQVDFSVKSKVPAWQTAPRPVMVTAKGQLFFNDLAPDNPRQTTIDEAGA